MMTNKNPEKKSYSKKRKQQKNGEITKNQEKALWDYYIEGKNYNEIAKELKIKPGTLKVQMHRLRNKLANNPEIQHLNNLNSLLKS